MCGISLILSGIHIVSSASNLFNGVRHADLGSSLQGGKWVSGILYPTVDDLKDVVSRRGPDHVGLERLQLKVVSGDEPGFRKELPIESQENNYLLGGTSYRTSEVNEKLKISVQMTSDSETGSRCRQMNNIESSFEEHMNKHSACSSNIKQATESSIVSNFVEGINGQTVDVFQADTFAEMLFVGAILQLRGVHPVYQPLVDLWMNVLVYNGEVFGGISVGEEENDTMILMNALQKCCSCPCHGSGRDCHCCHQKDHISVPQLLSTVKGPWSLIYWQAKSNIVWFGRDAFGRRSLLIHWPSLNDSRLLLSSAVPFMTAKKTSYGSCGHKGDQCQTHDCVEGKKADGSDDLDFWDELACGIYSISLETGKEFVYNKKDLFVSIVGRVEKHDWCNPQLKKLLNWERSFVEPGSDDSLMSKFTFSHIGHDTFISKENGMISSVIKKKEVKLGDVEYFDEILMKSRTATEDNQENKKMIYRNDASQLLIDQGFESEENQIFEGTDCFNLNSDMQQNNAKVQGFLDTVDSHTPLFSHKVKVDTNEENIHRSSTSIESPGFQEIATRILKDSFTSSAQQVLFALKKAVMRRTCQSQFNQIREGAEIIEKHVPIAVLFSGGLDSIILAALLNQCLDQKYEIDLLNVSFDGPHAPDRISAKAGLTELQRIAAFRRWHLVEIDADPSNLQLTTKYMTSVIHPAKTYMDLNIGTALWLAACGDGWVEDMEFPQREDEHHFNDSYLLSSGDKKSKSIRYKSEARILFVGSGADEQCAGYGRHRTKFRLGGWVALQEEMKIDVQRIWKRNLGRDDRCIADHGKEARFPFLDEDVIETLLDLPLWEIADLEEPSGQGDKKILRQVAQLLGLEQASTLPKRAIQFGSRISRESNRRNFGSNRAANQASAGSAVIRCLTE